MSWDEWLASRTKEDGDCLIWTKAVTSTQCPMAHVDGEYRNVRRWLLERQGVIMTPKLRAVPTCGNPLCLSHLKPMTASQVNHWLSSRGKYHSLARSLAGRKARERSTVVGSMETAREIRQLRAEGLTYKAISERTGVPLPRCHDVCANKTWVEAMPGASVFHI